MPAKGPTGKADTLFSKLVRDRDEHRCWAEGYVSTRGNSPQLCYTFAPMQCAHIISRSYRALRWRGENAVTMCAAHHSWFTYHDRDWEQYVRDRGRDYDELHWRALHDDPERPQDALERLKKDGLGG